jgi:uncharacterized iron-regulated membrane protein
MTALNVRGLNRAQQGQRGRLLCLEVVEPLAGGVLGRLGVSLGLVALLLVVGIATASLSWWQREKGQGTDGQEAGRLSDAASLSSNSFTRSQSST